MVAPGAQCAKRYHFSLKKGSTQAIFRVSDCSKYIVPIAHVRVTASAYCSAQHSNSGSGTRKPILEPPIK